MDEMYTTELLWGERGIMREYPSRTRTRFDDSPLADDGDEHQQKRRQRQRLIDAGDECHHDSGVDNTRSMMVSQNEINTGVAKRLSMENEDDGDNDDNDEELSVDQSLASNSSSESITDDNSEESAYDYEGDLFDLLPDDVLGKVLFSGYVDTLGLIKSLSCVSKRTQKVAKETVKLLDLRGCKHITPDIMGSIVTRFENVSTINLNYCTQFSGSHLLKMVPWSNTLQELHLRGSAVQDGEFQNFLTTVETQINGPSHLKVLDLSAIAKEGKLRVQDCDVIQISNSCPNLKWLRLGFCSGVTNLSIKSLGCLRFLNTLDLSLCTISSESCETLSTMETLKSLDISATRVGDAGIRNLFQVTSESPNSVAASDLTAFAASPSSNNCPNKHIKYESRLEVLRMQFNNDFSADTLRFIVSRAPMLKKLDLSHCTGLQKDESKASLRALKRNGTVIVDEYGASGIAVSSPHSVSRRRSDSFETL